MKIKTVLSITLYLIILAMRIGKSETAVAVEEKERETIVSRQEIASPDHGCDADFPVDCEDENPCTEDILDLQEHKCVHTYRFAENGCIASLVELNSKNWFGYALKQQWPIVDREDRRMMFLVLFVMLDDFGTHNACDGDEPCTRYKLDPKDWTCAKEEITIADALDAGIIDDSDDEPMQKCRKWLRTVEKTHAEIEKYYNLKK